MEFTGWTVVMVRGPEETTFTEWARFTLQGDAERFVATVADSCPTWTVEVRYPWLEYPTDEPTTKRRVCFNCGKSGHLQTQCTEVPTIR